MLTDFAYYYIQYKDGKITNLIKSNTRIEPVATDGSKTISATSNEYNLFKAVDKDIDFARQIIDDWDKTLSNDISQ
jgi:hypothetical protein